MRFMPDLGGERDHRRRVRGRVGDAEQQVDRAGAERRRAHAGLAGQPAVDLGHERGRLLVADEHVADRGRRQRLDEMDVLLAGNPEHVRDALVLEAPDDQLRDGRPPSAHIYIAWTLPSPPGRQHAAPVPPGDRLELGVREPGRAERVEHAGIPRDVAERGRDRGAVEVRAERHVLDPDPVGDVAGVLGDQRQRRVRRRRRSRRAGTGSANTIPTSPPDVADRVELAVGQVARGGAQRVGGGVAWRRAGRRRARRRPRSRPRSGG